MYTKKRNNQSPPIGHLILCFEASMKNLELALLSRNSILILEMRMNLFYNFNLMNETLKSTKMNSFIKRAISKKFKALFQAAETNLSIASKYLSASLQAL